MTTQEGIIYKITNNINNKCYIGQTISTILKRWAQHTSNARRHANKCVILENAMRKYGEDNFSIEQIASCNQILLNEYEIKFISYYKSNKIEFGYNICDGGGGSINRPVTENHRKKISKSNRKCDLDIMNIQERRVDDILIGYVVSKHINNIRYTKHFANTKNSLQENLELAKKWLQELDDGKTNDDNRYNRKFELPKNISYNYNNKKLLVGYNVKIEKNKKIYCKSFTFKDLSMEAKLKLAIQYKDELLKSLSENQ